jgi:hypothetical protein
MKLVGGRIHVHSSTPSPPRLLNHLLSSFIPVNEHTRDRAGFFDGKYTAALLYLLLS